MQDEIKTPKDWSELFLDYEQSGLNQRQYCEREGIKYFEFKYHRKKHLNRDAKASGFASVKIQAKINYDLELCLPQGRCLKINASTPVEYVKRLLQVIK